MYIYIYIYIYSPIFIYFSIQSPVSPRHPVGYLKFNKNLLVAANIPSQKCPETDENDSMLHRRSEYFEQIIKYDVMSYSTFFFLFAYNLSYIKLNIYKNQ